MLSCLKKKKILKIKKNNEENTEVKILLLKNKFIKIEIILRRLFIDNIHRLKVGKVKFKKEGSKYLPIISQDFINFMFANQKDNHFITMLQNPSGVLAYDWPYLYNHFDDIKEKCHGNITLKKVEIILKQISNKNTSLEVTPDNYKLNEMVDEIKKLDGIDLVLSPSELIKLGISEDFLSKDIKRLYSSKDYKLILVNSSYDIATDKLNKQVAKLNKIVDKYTL